MATYEAHDGCDRTVGDSPAIREQIERLSAAIRQAAGAEGRDAGEAAIKAAREAWAKTASLLDELADKAEGAKAAADQGRRGVERIIRDKPLLAVALAAAAGFLLASLVRR